MIPIGDERRPRGFPLVIYTLVTINVWIFVSEATAPHPTRFVHAFALIPYDVTHAVSLAPPSPHPYWLTILTSMFLHGSVLHIFFNMLFLMVFGPTMERYLGHLGLLFVYLICGVAGALTQIAADPNSLVPEIGASGAIAGILGAYIVTFPRNTIDTIVPIGCFPLFLRLPAVLVIGIWAAIQFVSGFGTVAPHDGGGIAYFAHIGGFLCGALVVGLWSLASGRNRRARPRRW